MPSVGFAEYFDQVKAAVERGTERGKLIRIVTLKNRRPNLEARRRAMETEKICEEDQPKWEAQTD